ncbi:MAG: hypothetical protein ACJASQ_001631 [Crocinitomicaceae bacterium]|jgi:hypothetical protein
MNLSNNELDQLFEGLRKEEPVVSYQETQKAFLTASVIAAGGVLATKGILKLLTFKKWIVMISILSTTAIGTVLVTMNAAPVTSENETEAVKTNTKEIILTPEEETEVTKEKLETFVATFESLVPKTKTVVISENKAPIEVKAYLKDNGDYYFTYVITSKTSKEDLETLQESAKKAGFELICTPKFKNDSLQHLNLHIVQKEKDGKETNILISDIDLEDDMEYKVAWNVDDKGTVTTIACGDDFKSEDVRDLLDELDIAELTSDIMRLYDEKNFEIVALEEGRINLDHYQEELEQALAILESEEVKASLLAIESIDSKELEELIEGLEEAQEDLEDARKDLRELKGKAKKCHEGHEKIIDALYEDGLIKDKKKRLKVKAANGKIEVNGKEIPKNLKKKYAKLIQEHFDVDVTDSGTEWQWSYDEN